jgi:hypothetical protein
MDLGILSFVLPDAPETRRAAIRATPRQPQVNALFYWKF